jgi:hypothetical protein
VDTAIAHGMVVAAMGGTDRRALPPTGPGSGRWTACSIGSSVGIRCKTPTPTSGTHLYEAVGHRCQPRWTAPTSALHGDQAFWVDCS